MNINPKHLRIESWPPQPTEGMLVGGGRPAVGVKVTHFPTGITYSFCEHRSQHKNLSECLRQIYTRLSVWESVTGGAA